MKPLYHIPIEIVNAELGQPLASHRTPILRYPLSTERIRIRSFVTTCALHLLAASTLVSAKALSVAFGKLA